jgi:hypothetical protein
VSGPVSGDEAREQDSPHDRPATGLPAVDEALARLDDLDQRPVSEHHAELAAAHETLHAELESPSGPADGRS